MKSHNIKERLFARDVMARDLVSVREDTPLSDAGLLMWNNKLGCLPVVDDAGVLQGIITGSRLREARAPALEATP